jgi:hypothetical protein
MDCESTGRRPADCGLQEESINLPRFLPTEHMMTATVRMVDASGGFPEALSYEDR